MKRPTKKRSPLLGWHRSDTFPSRKSPRSAMLADASDAVDTAYLEIERAARRTAQLRDGLMLFGCALDSIIKIAQEPDITPSEAACIDMLLDSLRMVGKGAASP